MSRRKRTISDLKYRNSTQTHRRRQVESREQRLLVIIACEGARTERLYFSALFDRLKRERKLANDSCVIADHKHTNPTGVLEDLKRHRTKLGDSFRDFDYRWIVIDRDQERTGGGGHSKEDFNNAIQAARSSRPRIEVAWSNPSFEIWYLLHFEYRNTAIDRDQLIDRLSIVMDRTYEKTDTEMYEVLHDHQSDAIRNAERLRSTGAESGVPPADANPGTTVHELVTLLDSVNGQHPVPHPD